MNEITAHVERRVFHGICVHPLYRFQGGPVLRLRIGCTDAKSELPPVWIYQKVNTDEHSGMSAGTYVGNAIFWLAQLFQMRQAGPNTPTASISCITRSVWAGYYQRSSFHAAAGTQGAISRSLGLARPAATCFSRYRFMDWIYDRCELYPRGGKTGCTYGGKLVEQRNDGLALLDESNGCIRLPRLAHGLPLPSHYPIRRSHEARPRRQAHLIGTMVVFEALVRSGRDPRKSRLSRRCT